MYNSAQPAHSFVDTVLTWLADRPPCFWRVLAFIILTFFFLVEGFHSSVVIDGKRYFALNDDQMISMRYARNFAEGLGLVWNPGERVEGYTNPLWTLIMAAVHVLPIEDAKTAVVIKVINWVLAYIVLLLSERLLRFFQPKPGLALPALLLTLATCLDLVFWATNGFETTLLTVIFLWAVLRVLEESRSECVKPGTYLLIGLIPIVRSDAYPVWLTVVLLTLAISKNRHQTMRVLGLAVVFPVMHLLYRRWYYGDWLPNTYYLKVEGVQGRLSMGVAYLSVFLKYYGMALAIAIFTLLTTFETRRWWLCVGLAINCGYVVFVGGDVFVNYSRFLAHFIPIILVLAMVGILEVAPSNLRARFLLLSMLSLYVFMQIGVHHPERLSPPTTGADIVTGVLIDRYARPEARVAVFWAGRVAYFSRRYAIDLLGKSDAYVAHQEPYFQTNYGGYIGHTKLNPDYSLGLEPDFVVTPHSHTVIASYNLENERTDYLLVFLRTPTFQQNYLPNPVPVPYLLNHTSVYAHSSSPEMEHLSLWQEPEISR